jgi:hypothetical protein
MEAPAVALKLVVVAPDTTVADTGTISRGLLLVRATVRPPLGVACVSVSVQLLVALCPRLVGLQTTLDSTTGATRLMVAVCELLPRVAVTVAL